MKRWISLGLISFILFWPVLLFAQSNSDQLILAPSNSDLSYIYLSNIFGTVDGVLYGTGSELLGHLFGIFNSAVLVLGGIVILYTFFIGTLKTAHEGEVLGKEWSSVWIPLRAIGGIALLVPKATGYSFIQILMMWIIVQGIGVADSVWNTALNYLTTGGIIIKKNISADGSGKNVMPFEMVKRSSTILRSLTCMEMLQLQISAYQGAQVQAGLPAQTSANDFYSKILSDLDNSNSTTILFPQSGFHNTDGVCGQVSWSNVYDDFPDVMKKNPEFDSWKGDKSRTQAVKQVITALDPYAKKIAANYAALATTPKISVPLGQLVGNKWSGPSGQYLIDGGILAASSASYYGTMQQVMTLIAQAASSDQATQDWIAPAKQSGWALAGMYYFDLVQANSKVSGIADGNLPTVTEPEFDFTNDTKVTDVLGGKGSPYLSQLQVLINGPTPTTGNTNPGAKNNYIVSMNSMFIVSAISFSSGVNYSGSDASAGAAGQMSAPASGATSSVSGFLGGLGDSENNNMNPVVAIAKFGDSLVNTSFVALLLMAILGFAATIGLGCIPFCSVGAAGVSLVNALTNLFTPLFVSLMTVGLTMAYYVPMIPFIIFSFGVIGWFIAVVEAMLAAPIVALGISHPEGSHAVLGKADPAVGLMINVFLRPTLMIFGLLFGMMMSYVGVWLLNQGFSQAFQGATGKESGGIFKPTATIVIYTMIVIQIVQKSFSLIHVIPDQIFRWIGINIQSMGGEAEAEQAVSAGAKKGMSETSSRAGGAVKMGTEAGGGIGAARQQAMKAKAKESSGAETPKNDEPGGGENSSSSSSSSSENSGGESGGGGTESGGNDDATGGQGGAGL